MFTLENGEWKFLDIHGSLRKESPLFLAEGWRTLPSVELSGAGSSMALSVRPVLVGCPGIRTLAPFLLGPVRCILSVLGVTSQSENNRPNFLEGHQISGAEC